VKPSGSKLPNGATTPGRPAQNASGLGSPSIDGRVDLFRFFDCDSIDGHNISREKLCGGGGKPGCDKSGYCSDYKGKGNNTFHGCICGVKVCNVFE